MPSLAQSRWSMPTAEQVKALIRSHVDGDDERFFAVAMQVAAQEARSGHRRFAEELRDLVDRARMTRRANPPRPVPVVRPKGELAGLLSASYPKVRLAACTINENSRAYFAGELAPLALSVGRGIYAGAAKALPYLVEGGGQDLTSALQVSAARNTLNRYFASGCSRTRESTRLRRSPRSMVKTHPQSRLRRLGRIL